MKKRLNKFMSIIFAVMMTASAFTLVACGDNGNPDADTTPVTVQVLGYLEDFGSEVVITSQLKDGLNPLDHGSIESNYYGKEIERESRIFLSHLDVPKGSYTAKLEGKQLGSVTVSQSGEADISSLPQGLTLGEKYSLQLTTSWGKTYTQTLKLVSRAIDNQDEYVEMINYYNIKAKRSDGTCDCLIEEVNRTEPCPHLNPKKYYNGTSFTQRLYVLDKDIHVDEETKWLGITGIQPPDGQPYQYKDPFANLQLLDDTFYFYDILDGQGHNICIDHFHTGGLFGNLATGAVVKNFSFNLALLATYTWDNYWGTSEYREDSINRFTLNKNYIATTISAGATVENVAIYNTTSPWSMYGMNALASVIKEGAVLKDIYLQLPSNLNFGISDHDHTTDGINAPSDPERLDVHEYYSGLLGYGCELEEVDNVVFVSPNMDHAFYKEVEGELVKYYAENMYDIYSIYGMYYFESAEEVISGGYSQVGSWRINANGTASYGGQVNS